MSDHAGLPLSGSGDDPRHHTGKLHDMLTRVAEHAREDVGKISEPKAQALFETAAEVCPGPATAFEHYEQESQPARRRRAAVGVNPLAGTLLAPVDIC